PSWRMSRSATRRSAACTSQRDMALCAADTRQQRCLTPHIANVAEGLAMWAQIIKTQLKPGMDSEYVALMDQFKAIEQPDSGLLRTFAMRDAKDPSSVYMMVVFES